MGNTLPNGGSNLYQYWLFLDFFEWWIEITFNQYTHSFSHLKAILINHSTLVKNFETIIKKQYLPTSCMFVMLAVNCIYNFLPYANLIILDSDVCFAWNWDAEILHQAPTAENATQGCICNSISCMWMQINAYWKAFWLIFQLGDGTTHRLTDWQSYRYQFI